MPSLYAHAMNLRMKAVLIGAESDYKADMTTLKSLAMSSIACYTFDFYGWYSGWRASCVWQSGLSLRLSRQTRR